MEQMNNETIDACIEAINNNATKSDENKARLIDMYESMRPEPTGPTNETVISDIKKWSSENGKPTTTGRSDAPPINEAVKSEIEKWSKSKK